MTETEKQKDIYILGIESSCDETAASVVKNGREVLSNVISSQIALHTLYGGVVPEIASRKHIEKINQVIEQALADAHVTLDDITAIAVTYGPGLVGALLVGVSEAKAISFATGIPLVGVHHIEGHISANFIENKELEPPFICLVASGGHSHLVVVKDYGEYEIIGRTRDDAAGEAFDKVARAIGLGYPGGPKIDKVSKEGNPDAIHFPRAAVAENEYDFSFRAEKDAYTQENHMPKRQQWQNTHRLPSIQREVPQMPVLTVPLEDRKSRPLRKFFFPKTPPPERGGRYFPPSFPCGMPQAAAVHRESYRPQTRGQKNEYMHSHPVLSFAFCASLFSALLSMYSRFIDNIRKRSACSAEPPSANGTSFTVYCL